MRSSHWFASLVLVCVPSIATAQAQKTAQEYLEAASQPSLAERLQQPEKTAAALRLESAPELRQQLSQNEAFQELKEELPKVQLDGTDFWIAEGDLLLDEDQLLLYAPQRAAKEALFEAQRRAGEFSDRRPPSAPSNELVGIVQNGQVVRWSPGTVLTYCVLKNTFSDGHYQEAVNHMAEATQQWEELCGVDFQYLPQHDQSQGVAAPTGVVFAVRGINAGGQFIASAFFPNDPPSRRRILIDPSFFNTSFDKTGVLRHELGHVVGFRHEHIRSEAPAACPNESIFDTIPLTAYDPRSVMHYFCGGSGSPQLAFTEADRLGSQKVYGPPLNNLLLVEP